MAEKSVETNRKYVDYAKLLEKYIEIVGEEEGTTFIGAVRRSPRLTEEERDMLLAMMGVEE
jgi:hypothetical protein